jgi:hypothetical protein
MRRCTWTLLLAACVALFAPAAVAKQELRLMDGFTATVQSPWPDTLCRGYAPVFVELRNDTDKVIDATVEVGSAYRFDNEADCVARTGVRVGVGERRQIELLVPFYRRYQRPANLRVEVGRTSANLQLSTGSGVSGPSSRLVAWVTPTPLPAGTVERVADALERSEADFLGLGGTPPPALPTMPALPTYGYAGARAPSGSATDWSVFEVLPGQLSSRAAAWSAIDTVVLDGRNGAAALAALPLEGVLSNARQGGLVVVLGERDVLTALGIEDTLEPRFELARSTTIGDTWRFGFGRVTWLGPNADLVDGATEQRTLVLHVLPVHTQHSHEGTFQPGTGATLELVDSLAIPGVADLPLEVFVILLLVFAAVIGPVNFIVLKRIGRPGLLLLTIPLISLATSLGILFIGIVHQGLDVKGAVHSFTLLDQRDDRAVTLSRQALMPGLATGDLLPARGTTVHTTAYMAETSPELAVEHGDGLRLAGGWAPVRTTTNLLVSSDAPARSRIELRRDGDELELVNTLDTEILGFAALDAAEQLYVLAAGTTVAPGGKARLARAAEPPTERSGNTLAGRASLGPSSYRARVATNPFLDNLGLEPSFKAENHLIHGILPADEALWSK